MILHRLSILPFEQTIPLPRLDVADPTFCLLRRLICRSSRPSAPLLPSWPRLLRCLSRRIWTEHPLCVSVLPTNTPWIYLPGVRWITPAPAGFVHNFPFFVTVPFFSGSFDLVPGMTVIGCDALRFTALL